MAINFSDLAGGGGSGGVFTLMGRDSGVIALGVTGNILTRSLADYPGATHMKLFYLLTTAAGGDQVGISVITEKGTVISGTLSKASPNLVSRGGSFGVQQNFASWANSQHQGSTFNLLTSINCKQLTLQKNEGNTTVGIEWGIEYGTVE